MSLTYLCTSALLFKMLKPEKGQGYLDVERDVILGLGVTLRVEVEAEAVAFADLVEVHLVDGRRLAERLVLKSILNFLNNLRSGCSTAVERMPHDKEVVGWNPARCWAFFSSLSHQ